MLRDLFIRCRTVTVAVLAGFLLLWIGFWIWGIVRRIEILGQ